MGEFIPPTSLCPFHSSLPVSTPGNKTISSFLFCGLYRACVRVSVCKRESWGAGELYVGLGKETPGQVLG